MAFAGLDSYGYPGDFEMKMLKKHTNLVWTGYYLGPKTNYGFYPHWVGKYQFLAREGWGLAPLYAGQQWSGAGVGNPKLNENQGVIDGLQAAALAGKEGFPHLSVIYLDIEVNAPLLKAFKTAPMLDYFQGWTKGLHGNGYLPGAYCWASAAPQLLEAVPETYIWAIKASSGKIFHDTVSPLPDPKGATAWQFAYNAQIEFGIDKGDLNPKPILKVPTSLKMKGSGHRLTIGADLQKDAIDLDSSLVRDPSQAAYRGFE